MNLIQDKVGPKRSEHRQERRKPLSVDIRDYFSLFLEDSDKDSEWVKSEQSSW